MILPIVRAFTAISLLVVGSGCGNKNQPVDQGGGIPTQGGAPPPAQTYAGVDLDQLTRDLRRWIVGTKQKPTSMEDYVAKSKAIIPPAPAGKKFAISKEMRIILVDR